MLGVVVADGREGAGRVGGAGDDFGIDRSVAGEGDGHAVVLAELGHLGSRRGGVGAELVVEPALEVARHLDVHRRVHGRDDGAAGVDAGVEEAGEDVVLVGRQDEAADGQAHALGVPAGQDVAEVAGRDGELDVGGVGFVLDAEGGPEVVDDLREDARPVDGVDGAEGVGVLEGEVVEEGLHDGLAVVERAFDGQVEDVGVEDGRHLLFLERADAAVGVHHEDVDALLPAHAADGRAAGVAARRRQDVQAAVALGQDVLKEAAEELEGDVLEGEGRSVEELQDVDGADAQDGRDFGGVEGGVGAVDEGAEALGGDVIGEEGDDAEGEVGVVEVAPGVEFGGDVGDAVGDEKAAVAGEAGHHGVLEGEGGLVSAGGDVSDGVHGGGV